VIEQSIRPSPSCSSTGPCFVLSSKFWFIFQTDLLTPPSLIFSWSNCAVLARSFAGLTAVALRRPSCHQFVQYCLSIVLIPPEIFQGPSAASLRRRARARFLKVFLPVQRLPDECLLSISSAVYHLARPVAFLPDCDPLRRSPPHRHLRCAILTSNLLFYDPPP